MTAQAPKPTSAPRRPVGGSDPFPPACHPRSAQVAVLASRLVDGLETPAFFDTLAHGLAGFVRLDNFIVFTYQDGFAAELVYSNFDADYLRQQMAPYTSGLYLLDPFYIADTQHGRRGLLHLGEVAPAGFFETEFYLSFYKAVAVLDELRIAVPLGIGRSTHVFIEREPGSSPFEAEEIASLNELMPMVISTIRKHWAWRDLSRADRDASRVAWSDGVAGAIRNIRPGALTGREVEVIELALRGHASKIIAVQLAISEGTVNNHKRNVYEKLGIHSQAQLFSLFLTSLSRGASAQ